MPLNKEELKALALKKSEELKKRKKEKEEKQREEKFKKFVLFIETQMKKAAAVGEFKYHHTFENGTDNALMPMLREYFKDFKVEINDTDEDDDRMSMTINWE